MLPWQDADRNGGGKSRDAFKELAALAAKATVSNPPKAITGVPLHPFSAVVLYDCLLAGSQSVCFKPHLTSQMLPWLSHSSLAIFSHLVNTWLLPLL
jgi:hypothetical protein